MKITMTKQEIRIRIIECLEAIGIFLDIDDSTDVNICEYGMDSFGYIVFVCEVENVFDVEIPDAYLNIQDIVSLNKMVDVVYELYQNK